ncbi:putative Ig domain-containing protein [Leptospira stimsonii]|uniref:Uncharacterized protein n=1 Tax=Leptospira stimsonii TaxID=2202203 RepID=A0ABY2N148_9LEPT|nr:hypothetical protein EHO98_10400 [Leptospira stimsonii]TGM13789.1 hypothetical protein EHQ90_12795 [Leptospira stimsonii]
MFLFRQSTDRDGVATSFSVSRALPSGLSLDSATGAMSGIPTSKQTASS